MPRYFVGPSGFEGEQVTISGDDARHIRLVLRLRPGDTITVVDREGLEYQAVIIRIEGMQVISRVVDGNPGASEPSLVLNLIQGLPKGDKLEYIIQKCTEIGVATIAPVDTMRTVVRLTGEKAGQRLERWRKIAGSAAQQSGRGRIPSVLPVSSLKDALNRIPSQSLVLIPWEKSGDSLRQVLRRDLPCKNEVTVMVGPEGGWDRQEVEMACQAGAIAVSLGPRIMRTETAGLVVLSIILYEAGDLEVPGRGTSG